MKALCICLFSLFSTHAFAYTAIHQIGPLVRPKTIPVLQAALNSENSMLDLVDPQGKQARQGKRLLTIGISIGENRVQAIDTNGEIVFDAIVTNATPIYQLVEQYGGMKNVRIVIQ
ncbi:MAG TPA: hypothetical protein PKC28_07240 [Bdellovibrionales bacterium]|nr:hypothetical protein [Bdellovibrionales bacterium]